MKRWVFEFLKDLFEKKFKGNPQEWGMEMQRLLKKAFKKAEFNIVSLVNADIDIKAVRGDEKYLLEVKTAPIKPTPQIQSKDIENLKKAEQFYPDYKIGVAVLTLRETDYWKIGTLNLKTLKPGSINPDFDLKERFEDLEKEINQKFEEVIGDAIKGMLKGAVGLNFYGMEKGEKNSLKKVWIKIMEM
jgi:Holliday junction resolvase